LRGFRVQTETSGPCTRATTGPTPDGARFRFVREQDLAGEKGGGWPRNPARDQQK